MDFDFQMLINQSKKLMIWINEDGENDEMSDMNSQNYSEIYQLFNLQK
jgi:hypothetical protein